MNFGAYFRARRRRAAAVVEMAVVTPLLLTMLFGIIEYGWVFSIKQSVTNAAREGCRVASMQGSTDAEIDNTVKAYLDATGLSSSDYTITLKHYTQGDPTERVSVSVPYGKVSLLGGFFGNTNWSLGSSLYDEKGGRGLALGAVAKNASLWMV